MRELLAETRTFSSIRYRITAFKTGMNIEYKNGKISAFSVDNEEFDIVGDDVTSSCRWYHIRAAATLMVRPPVVDGLIGGTTRR